MKLWRRRLRNLVLLGLLCGAFGVGLRAARHAWQPALNELSPLTMTIQPRDFSLLIAAKGELQAAQSSAIAVPPVPVNRLRIASVVADGRYVNKGDVLVEFDPAELDLQKQEQRAGLEMAQQKMTKGGLANQTEKTDIGKDRKLAELELRKINEFLPQDEQIYTRRDIIEGQINQAYAEKKIVFADARLQLKDKVYSLDEAILLLERQQANNLMGRVEKALGSLKLLAPAAGIVVYPNSGYFFGGNALMPGKVVWIGMTLFQLVNPEKMEAKVYVLERDAGELKIEQPVTFTLDPFPGRSFSGKVKAIDKVARPVDRGSPVKYFETVVTLEKTEQDVMKPGVKLDARVHAGELKNVTVIPRSAVVSKDSGFVAFVQKAAGQFDPVPVKLGQGDLAQVVVTEGLRAGQVLALNPPDVKRDGEKDKNTTNQK
ncbi:MAG: HlyD family efflux transporter periplasmic adaptor subunit [Acidobacteria bacterium]|nr:HlyD family efflux transporter periplasmic adaptor subunit [Acidobacteriota bacterium]MBI3426045.1 HlyD family efflux transporter periplasmic adaptor subunit [Acidobacteriota bacterium]